MSEDLDHILKHTTGVWEPLRGGRIFITGGTGFFGQWMLESFLRANDALGLGARATVLTRDPRAFSQKAPRLAAHPALSFHEGDITSFSFPKDSFTHVIHAATPVEQRGASEKADPTPMIRSIVEGTKRTLEFARHSGAREFLYLSSGAVYGRQPPELSQMDEKQPAAASIETSAYGFGKLQAEQLVLKDEFVNARVARCFAFVGPHLPLDGPYAIGNFIRDGLAGQALRIQGDGTPWRSYLYAADLMIWLWTLLARGRKSGVYNVGSDLAITIAQLASEISSQLHVSVDLAAQPDPSRAAQRYVPSVKSAKSELGLDIWIDLPEAIRRTIRWNREKLDQARERS